MHDIAKSQQIAGHYLMVYSNEQAMIDCQGLACTSVPVLQAINEGYMDLAMVFVHETFTRIGFDEFQKLFYARLKMMNITRHNSVRVILGSKFPGMDQPNELGVKWLYYPWYAGIMREDFLRDSLNQTPEIMAITNKAKSYLSLGGRDRPHRLMLIKELQHLGRLDQGIVTLSKNAFEDLQLAPSADLYDSHNPLTGMAKPIMGCQSWYRQAAWDVVQDTVGHDDQTTFVSEKVFRSMIMGVPFVINGSFGVLATLRELGFETFDGIIDESYDHISDPEQRCRAVAQEIDKICSWTPEQKQQAWMEIHPRVQHNQNLCLCMDHLKNLHDLLSS
jgi:hypothetical protein